MSKYQNLHEFGVSCRLTRYDCPESARFGLPASDGNVAAHGGLDHGGLEMNGNKECGAPRKGKVDLETLIDTSPVGVTAFDVSRSAALQGVLK